MSLPTHKAALTREAARIVALRSVAASAPLVLWQRLGESLAAFDARAADVRARRPAAQVLLTVQAGKRETPPVSGTRPVELAEPLFNVLHPSVRTRYRLASGGRGSGKSFAFATALVLRALTHRVRVLCCREIQKSIRESVHRLLCDRIDALGLTRYFDVQEHSIRASSGAEFLFEGLYSNVTKIKSLEGLNYAWIEQAEAASPRSLEVLAPTVRAAGSEIWLTTNPDNPLAPVESFRDRPDTRHVHVTFEANPWFPDVLRSEMAYLQRVDDDMYRHVWLGEYRMASDAQVFRNKYSVDEFVAAGDWSGPYLGADFGFSQDPTTLVRCWVHERTLYIDYEAYGIGVDIDRTPALFDGVPDARRHTVRADSSRPETISYLQRHGYGQMVAVEKWSGSVEDGIAHLRQYERIVVHPRCPHVADELRLYSYKVDKLSGNVLPDLIDKHNHCIDALRYAINPLIQRRGPDAILAFYESQLAKEPNLSTDRTRAVITPLGGLHQ